LASKGAIIKLIVAICLIVGGIALSLTVGLAFNQNETGTGIQISGTEQPVPFALCCGGMIMIPVGIIMLIVAIVSLVKSKKTGNT